MASSSYEDRFSTLPESVTNCVLKFLDVEDLSILMLVSKRSKKVCLSAPMLNVDSSKHCHDPIMLSHYHSLVDKYLDARLESGNMIRDLKFSWSSYKEVSRLRKRKKRVQTNNLTHGSDCLYLKAVNKLDVENLELTFIDRDQPCYLPPLERNLKNVTIKAKGVVIHFPSRVNYNATKLENLGLAWVQFAPESKFDYVVSQIRSLKELHLHDCNGLEIIRIKSLSLISLKIHFHLPVPVKTLFLESPCLKRLCVKWFSTSDVRPSILLSVPELETLEWMGFPFDNLSFFKTTPLQYAEVSFIRPSRVYPGQPIQASPSFISMAMRQLKTAKSIKLHTDTIELAYKNGVLPCFESSKLAVDYCAFSNREVPAIASLLRNMPNLESLIMTPSASREVVEEMLEKFGSRLKGCDVSYWDSQNLVLGQLKRVAIKVFDKGNTLEFAKYLLKCACSLECLSILCRENLKSSIEEEIMGYKSLSTTVLFSSD